jgi:hypothetical protein
MVYNNGMPASYDSWRTSGPPDPSREDYQEMIDEKLKEINNTVDDLKTEVEGWGHFEEDEADVFNIKASWAVLEGYYKTMREKAKELEELIAERVG